MKTNKDLKMLGTEEERVMAYREDRKNNFEIKMLEHRLTDLYNKGIVEGEEIDSLLERICKVQTNLQWAWNIQYVLETNKTA